MDINSNFNDEIGERFLETGKKVVKYVGDVVKVDRVDKTKKIDPVTGKPIPSKKVLTQLNQQVAQLAQMRMKKVREELEKQRLKVRGQGSGSSGQSAQGPEVPVEPERPKEDVISRVLKASKSTGEFGKNIGG